MSDREWITDRAYIVWDNDTKCPACDNTQWSTYSDGLDDVASVAKVCTTCSYAATSVVDLSLIHPVQTKHQS